MKFINTDDSYNVIKHDNRIKICITYIHSHTTNVIKNH